MEMTFKLVDGMLVAAATPEEAAAAGLKEGARFVVRTEGAAGLRLEPSIDTDRRRMMAAVIDDHDEALKLLADR